MIGFLPLLYLSFYIFSLVKVLYVILVLYSFYIFLSLVKFSYVYNICTILPIPLHNVIYSRDKFDLTVSIVHEYIHVHHAR